MMSYIRKTNIGILLCISIMAGCYSWPEGIRSLHDLCSAYNGVVHMVDENKSFQLVINSLPFIQTPRMNSLKSRSRNMCNLEFKVCPSCHLAIEVSNMRIPSCLPGECMCNFFEIKEPWSGHSKKFCENKSDTNMYFESKTKYVTIDFVQSVHDIFYVSLNFTALRNVYVISGMPSDVSPHAGFIESPHFPVKYPSDYSADYILHSGDPAGYVQLIFLDFLLSQQSFIEVDGHDDSRVDTFTGELFRPPAVVSKGTTLHLKFSANDQPSRPGFRARYIFAKSAGNDIKKPNTDCGSDMEDYGGTVSFSVPDTSQQWFDCIWLIHRPVFSLKSLSAVVIEFKETGIGSFLEFREGLTSKSNLLKSFQCKNSNCNNMFVGSEVLISSTLGFYVRYSGYLTRQSSIIISYASFKEKDCIADEFACSNNRCIKKFLHCDGYNHCGDNSDEKNCQDEVIIATTTSKTPVLVPQLLYSEENSVHIGVKSLILIVVACGLVIVVVTTFLIVKKWYKTRRLPPTQEQTQPLHVMSENLDPPPPRVLSTVPAVIDRPPTYDEVMKFGEMFPSLTCEEPCLSVDSDCSSNEFQNSTAHSEEPAANTNVLNSNYFLDSANTEFHINCVTATYSTRPSSRILPSINKDCSVSARNNEESYKSPHTCNRSVKFCQSLDSVLKLNHCSGSKFSFCHPLNYKVDRCSTLPSDYKLSEEEQQRILSHCHAYENSSSRASVSSGPNSISCSFGSNPMDVVSQYSCTFVTNFVDLDGLPFVRNRCMSAPSQRNFPCSHNTVSKQKATTL